MMYFSKFTLIAVLAFGVDLAVAAAEPSDVPSNGKFYSVVRMNDI